jgi:hypothetical protein
MANPKGRYHILGGATPHGALWLLCDPYPYLRDDPDYNRENPGITIVEL